MASGRLARNLHPRNDLAEEIRDRLVQRVERHHAGRPEPPPLFFDIVSEHEREQDIGSTFLRACTHVSTHSSALPTQMFGTRPPRCRARR